MLEYLRIRNLALIEDVELEFAPGMNVLTGETGAGKSFILKALGFLLGDRLAAEMVRAGAERAQVEALFHCADTELILRRELMGASGRSRLYINDKLHSQERLRSLREQLLSFTSQHAQQKLLQPSFQAALLEGGLPRGLLQQRDSLLAQLNELAKKRAAVEERQAFLQERRSLLEMQQEEIDKVDPQPGEEEELEALCTRAKSVEHIAKDQSAALALVYGAEEKGLLDRLGHLEDIIQRLSEHDAALHDGLKNIAALRQELAALGSCLRRPVSEEVSVDIDALEARLFALAQLKRKFHKSLPEILALREEIEKNLSFLDVCALDIMHFDKQIKAVEQELAALLQKIIPERRKSAAHVTKQLEEELCQLGFSEQVRVVPDFVSHEIWPGIMEERGSILWAPNPGQPPLPLDKIASGGELSRFLLALTTVQMETDDSTTLLFDEVDAGVGGLTLNKLAEKLCQLAQKHQLLLITHWPQLAAQAHRHFQISKIVRSGETFTLCTALDPQGRHEELVRMAGGGPQGEALAQSLGSQ
jgi:DNA repair protein RecN (Recombination protein N)